MSFLIVFAISAVSSAKSTKNFEDTAKDPINVELHAQRGGAEDSGHSARRDTGSSKFDTVFAHVTDFIGGRKVVAAAGRGAEETNTGHDFDGFSAKDVQSALMEDARDKDATAAHGAPTKSSPTTSIRLTLSTSPVSNATGDGADHSEWENLKMQLDTCTTSLHAKEDKLSEVMEEISRCRTQRESALSRTSDLTTAQARPGQAMAKSQDTGEIARIGKEDEQRLHLYEAKQWHFYMSTYMTVECDLSMSLTYCETDVLKNQIDTPLFTRAELANAQCCAIRMYESRSGRPGVNEISTSGQEDSLTSLVSFMLGFRRNGERLLDSSVPPEFKDGQQFLEWHRQNPVDRSQASKDLFPPPFKGYGGLTRVFLFRLRQNTDLHFEEDGLFTGRLFDAGMETMRDLLDQLTITERAAIGKERHADFRSATYFTRDAIDTVLKKSKDVEDSTVAHWTLKTRDRSGDQLRRFLKEYVWEEYMFERFRTCGTEFSKADCEKTCCQWRKILEAPLESREGLFGPLVDMMLRSGEKGFEELMAWDEKHWDKAEKLNMFPPDVPGYGLVRFALWEVRRDASRDGPVTPSELRAATDDLVREIGHDWYLDKLDGPLLRGDYVDFNGDTMAMYFQFKDQYQSSTRKATSLLEVTETGQVLHNGATSSLRRARRVTGPNPNAAGTDAALHHRPPAVPGSTPQNYPWPTSATSNRQGMPNAPQRQHQHKQMPPNATSGVSGLRRGPVRGSVDQRAAAEGHHYPQGQFFPTQGAEGALFGTGAARRA
jgi:hypothetical protein